MERKGIYLMFSEDYIEQIAEEISKQAYKRGKRREELNIPGTPDDDWLYAEARVMENRYKPQTTKRR